jgi:hypothetical protein
MAIHSVELWLKGLAAAGVSPISVAQMLEHSSTQTVPRYAQVLHQNLLDAMRKLEAGKQDILRVPAATKSVARTRSATSPTL